jgi:hypothetical protein
MQTFIQLRYKWCFRTIEKKPAFDKQHLSGFVSPINLSHLRLYDYVTAQVSLHPGVPSPATPPHAMVLPDYVRQVS